MTSSRKSLAACVPLFRFPLVVVSFLQDERASISWWLTLEKAGVAFLSPAEITPLSVLAFPSWRTLLANDIVNRRKIMQQPDLADKDAMPSA